MISPFITIVTPVYNAEPYLTHTLESLRRQSFGNWECMLVDDGSSDTSMEIAEAYGEEDRRFQSFVRADYNDIKGANSCRNIGLELANANWVMFVDADDLLKEDCIARRVSTIESNPGFDFYVFKTAFVDNEMNFRGNFYNPNTIHADIIYRLVKHQIPWHTMSPVWQSRFLRKIGGWNSGYERLQDVELDIRALLWQPMVYFSKSGVDSFYRHNPMTHEKRQAARMGFCRIIHDYYGRLMSHESIPDNYKNKIHVVFQNMIENLLMNYMKNANERNLIWENLYLKTLSALALEEEEIETVRRVFDKMSPMQKAKIQ